MKYHLLVMLIIITLLFPGCQGFDPAATVKPGDAPAQTKVPAPSTGSSTIEARNASELVLEPERIIYWHDGVQTVVKPGAESYAKIVSMAQKRASGARDMYKSMVEDADIKALQNGSRVLEFQYAQKIQARWHSMDFKYDRFFFPLDGEFNNYMLIVDSSGSHYGPIGPPDASADLLPYLESLDSKSDHQ